MIPTEVLLIGSSLTDKMDSSHSARFRLARSGETSRRQSPAGELPVSRTSEGSPGVPAEGTTVATDFRHEPVMADEIVEVFASVPAGWIVDMTLGGGGHARRLLESRPDCRLLGIDRDRTALAAAGHALSDFSDRFTAWNARFDALPNIMTELSISTVAGVLFDLGVSSHQFDEADRGFSYRFDAPLDMRMDVSEPLTASDVVNTYSEAELTRVLSDYGDERFARRIARSIIAARPVATTGALVEVVRAAIPAALRRTGGHPAKRTFQALRIEVNRELAILPGAIDAAISATTPGGRVAVLSYHSGEDRIVKERFRHATTGGCTCPSGYPCVCGAVAKARIVRPEKRVPSLAEQQRNRRSSSAILRVVERVEER